MSRDARLMIVGVDFGFALAIWTSILLGLRSEDGSWGGLAFFGLMLVGHGIFEYRRAARTKEGEGGL